MRQRLCLFLLLLSILLIPLLSTACDIAWLPAIASVSNDGHWAIVIEQVGRGEEISGALVLLDLVGEQPASTIATNISINPEVSLSPDDRFLLYRDRGENWTVLNFLSANEQGHVVASKEERVNFLANGQLLVMSPVDETNLVQLSLVENPEEPEKRSRLPRLHDDTIRFIFANPQPVYKSDSSAGACLSSQSFQQDVRVFINSENSVYLLNTANTPLTPQLLSPALSAIVTNILDEQRSLDEQQVASFLTFLQSKLPLMEKTIREEVEAGSEQISTSELDQQVNYWVSLTEARLEREAFDNSNTLGALSADGTKLLFLKAETTIEYDDENSVDSLLERSHISVSSEGVHTLYLIDLSTGKPPQVLAQVVGPAPHFTFSPDGTQILYEGEDLGNRVLYLASVSAPIKSRRIISQGENLVVCWH